MNLIVIDTLEELNLIPRDKTLYGHIIYDDINLHPVKNLPVYVFLFDLHFEQCWAIDLHNSSLISPLNEVLKEIICIYSVEYYSFYITFGIETIDVRFNHYLVTGDIIDIDESSDQKWYKSLLHSSAINGIIPLVRQLEYVRGLLEHNWSDIAKEYTSYYSKYQKVCAKLMQNPFFNKQENEVYYSWYNLYTSTGRPSNRFGGVNFAAIPKTDVRQYWIPSDKNHFIELDFRAYHVYLIAFLIDYEFSQYPYTQLASELYTELNDESIKSIKEYTFKQLYGHTSDTVLDHPFFNKVKFLQDSLWEQYLNDGFIVSPITQRKIHIKDANKPKLFNYFIQLIETERNMEMLSDLPDNFIRYISLYVYDSILIDAPSINVFTDDIIDIITHGRKFEVSTKIGSNYYLLTPINIY